MGKALDGKTTEVEQSWVIRNHAYQMRVAPFGNNPEMIVIRSDSADFVFPAGRYALDDRFHEPDHGTGDLLVDSSFAVK
jgi:hypothetical protein